jgi:hypothetical protein
MGTNSYHQFFIRCPRACSPAVGIRYFTSISQAAGGLRQIRLFASPQGDFHHPLNADRDSTT